jgi:hypothetical protein
MFDRTRARATEAARAVLLRTDGLRRGGLSRYGLLFLGFLGNRLAQPHWLKGLAALDRLGYEHAGADQ